MVVLGIIAFIVICYMMTKADEQREDELRKQKEAQEIAARLSFEGELKRKSKYWAKSSFFTKIVDPITIDINKRITSAATVKISRKESDRFTISCSDSKVTIKKPYSIDYYSADYHHDIQYKTLGFDNLQDDNSHSTIASLNWALYLYLQKRYQPIPGISFSLGRKSLTDYICTYGDLHWDSLTIVCDITKVHSLLEEITLP